MLFGGGRRKKIETALTAAKENAEAGNFAEAKKAAEEAYKLASEALGEHAADARAALMLMVHGATKVGDWAGAQAWLERAFPLFEAKLGHDWMDTQLLRRSLIDIYQRREHHSGVLALVQKALTQYSDQHPEHAVLRAFSALSLAALGRIDEAVANAQGAYDDANSRFADRNDGAICAITGVQLAKVLIETGRDPATGFGIIERFRQKSDPRTVPELESFLEDSHLQALGHVKAGNLNEAAQFLQTTLDMAFEPVWKVGGYSRLLYGRLQGLLGEALAALGQLTDAEEKVKGAIREVEAAASPRSAELVPILESYARVLRTRGDERGAETQEKRAATIRSLITGKKVAPVKQEPRKAVTAIWPRRTLAGVFQLRNAPPGLLAHIIATVARAVQPTSREQFGFETIPAAGDEAFIVLYAWEKAWVPAVAVDAKNWLAALSGIVSLINTGVEAAGGRPVEIEPWAAVRDTLACAVEQWPLGHREKLIREVFPTLPGWNGGGELFRWLGEGIRLQDGRPRFIAPTLQLSFVPNKGLDFSGFGPTALLDKWFLSFARATNLFPPATYSRLSEAPSEARPLMSKTIARA